MYNTFVHIYQKQVEFADVKATKLKEGQKAEADYDDLKAKLEQEAVVMRRWPRLKQRR